MILVSSHFGYPLSSTHVISGGVTGAGAAKRLSAVRWGLAGNIAVAWLLTLPAAGLFGAVAYWIANTFGHGALGPLLVTVLTVGAIGSALAMRRERPTLDAAGGTHAKRGASRAHVFELVRLVRF